MDNSESSHQNEIDLAKLIEVIKIEKFWVILSIILSLGASAIYIVMTPPVFSISIGITARVATPVLDQIFENTELSWTVGRKYQTAVHTTSKPLELKKYGEDLEGAALKTKHQLLDEFERELIFINNLNPQIVNTDIVAETVLTNARFISKFKSESENLAIFSSPVEKLISPRYWSILALSLFGGGIIGICVALIRTYCRKNINP